jgi:predicted ArsR family transcriptional regulator
MEESSLRREVDRFILDLIDSVPHLEALLLLWNSRPKHWTIDELAHALYIPNERTREILLNLQQRDMVVVQPQECFYNAAYSRDALISEVDRTYRRELVRISTMIHSKASPSVREFARAFRFKKD